jgi:hypothetical protein
MARVSLLGRVCPDANADAPHPKSSVIDDTNQVFPHILWAFRNSGTGTKSLGGSISIPSNYGTSGTVKIIIVWKTPATTGDMKWFVSYRDVATDESFNPTTADESLTVVTTAKGTTLWRAESEVTLTAANLVANHTLLWRVGRAADDAADTLAAEALLEDVLLEYTPA